MRTSYVLGCLRRDSVCAGCVCSGSSSNDNSVLCWVCLCARLGLRNLLRRLRRCPEAPSCKLSKAQPGVPFERCISRLIAAYLGKASANFSTANTRRASRSSSSCWHRRDSSRQPQMLVFPALAVGLLGVEPISPDVATAEAVSSVVSSACPSSGVEGMVFVTSW